MKDFVERFSTLSDDRQPGPDRADRVCQFPPGAAPHLREGRDPAAEWARDQGPDHTGREAISKRVFELTRDTPFLVTSVVVGNIQYPEEVANAVSAKMAATQVLERKQTEIAIEEREKQKRIVQAEASRAPWRSSTRG